MNTLNKRFTLKHLFAVIGLLAINAPMVEAKTFPLPSHGDVIGEEQTVFPQSNETLIELARRFDIGYEEIIRVNPHISPQSRLSTSTRIFVPSRFILPPGSRQGIVINLAELRMYYYPAGRNVVITKPIGIGREGKWQTPVGVTKITSKERDPYWHPTPNVRAEAARNGTPIPEIFPPGPDNPLGKHLFRLGWGGYLIHGTNRPETVGGRVSAGCIRLLPEDIKEVFDMIPVGTEVRVMNEPFKAGWLNGRLFFEAHYPLEEQQQHYAADMTSVVNTIHKKVDGHRTLIKWSVVENAARRPNGVPQIVNY